MEFLLAHSLSLMRSLWTATQLLFSLPEILLRVYSIPPSRLFMRIINKSRPSTKSCGTLLVTGLHLVFEMLLTTSTVSQFGSFAIHLPICLYNPHFLRFSEKMVMKGNIKSFAKVRIKLFHFSPFINQSPRCRRLSSELRTISPSYIHSCYSYAPS